MNIRTFMSDKQALIEEGKRIVTSSDDAKYLRKVIIVNLLLNGASTSALSELCGESSRTLSAWVKQVDEGGFEALRPKKQPGRPNKLTKDQKEEIKVVILSEPSLYGYNVWDGPSLSDFILKKYDVKLGVRQCQRLFHQLGFSQIRPQTFPSKDHEEDPSRGEFKKTERALLPEENASCISGRGSLHGGSYNYPSMVPKGKLSESQILSRTEICGIQRLHYLWERRTLRDQAFLVQL